MHNSRFPKFPLVFLQLHKNAENVFSLLLFFFLYFQLSLNDKYVLTTWRALWKWNIDVLYYLVGNPRQFVNRVEMKKIDLVLVNLCQMFTCLTKYKFNTTEIEMNFCDFLGFDRLIHITHYISCTSLYLVYLIIPRVQRNLLLGESLLTYWYR